MSYTTAFDQIGHDDIALAGGKGANLGELTRAGLPVPPGFVLGTPAYQDFLDANDRTAAILTLAALPVSATPADYEHASERIRALFTGGVVPEAMATELATSYARLGEDDGGGEVAVAVRSSATAEDLASASFAGQQDTYLNIRGIPALIAAVIDCWASLWTARAMAYRAREGIDPAGVRLAVVVQRMVEADAAGVMFTANPSNGRRDQIAISAAWGLGESVVSGAVSTDDLVIEARGGRVLFRRTADKQVMTVYTAHGTEERPVPEARRRQPALDDTAAAELAGLGTRIAAHYGAPQDIEWARAGGRFAIVQARPITALPEPTAEAPTDWTVPYPNGVYFRVSIVEQLPDPLTPLFADLIDGAVTRSLTALMEQAFGAGGLREGDVRFPTVNGYAYYYYRTTGLLRILRGSPAAVITLAKGGAHMGIRGWREYSHPRYTEVTRRWAARPLGECSARELLDGVSELLDASMVYYTAVQSIVPIAATSEIMFRSYYDRLVKRPGDPPGETFLLGYDSEPIRAEKSLYDLAMWTREHPALAEELLSGHRPSDTQWNTRFQDHLDRHGHVIYNLDFATPVPADDPTPLLDTLRFHLRGHGNDPYQRQRRSAQRREAATQQVLARLDPPRRAAFTRLLRWAQRSAPVREDALADIGLAWPAIRRMLAELGRRLTETGVISGPAEVYWLHHDELRAAALEGAAPALTDTIQERTMLWRGQRRATAPQMLPESGWIQRSLGWAMPAGDQKQTSDTITGVGASAGQVTAPARVLTGPEQFSQMRPGDVLVARMTTPAWTSLFAMASAVVTDIGGPLSHSSIVAREYGIPAVLGTGVATQRLTSGQLVRVDGDTGTVTLENGSTAGRSIPGNTDHNPD